MTQTRQMEVWRGEFGRDYTERNIFEDVDAFNRVFVERFGRSRDDLNQTFVGHLDRDIRILEVGANVGNQLHALARMGFRRLYGVELQRDCVNRAHSLFAELDIIEGSAFDLPFKDGYFDLIFTNNVLIHISPNDIDRVFDEMHRCTRQHIYGAEYYAENWQEVPYRGNNDLLWKADYASLMLERFADLELERSEILPYLNEPDLRDRMYLLRKAG